MRNFIGKILGFVMRTVPNKLDSLEKQTTEDPGGIRAMMNRLHDAVNEKALPELLDMVTDDVVLLTASGAPTVGRDAVKALCTDLFGKFDISHQHELGGQEIGNVAINGGGYLTTLTPLDGGRPVTMRGRVVAVLRRENGVWKLSRGLIWANWNADDG